MAKIVSIHSFRRGTGKTNLVASLGAVMAAEGRRIGLVDADFQSPSMHILFGVDEKQLPCFLNDYMHRACEIEETALDLTDDLDVALSGCMFLIPSNPSPTAIVGIQRTGIDAEWLGAGCQCLIQSMSLDVLLIDTHAGISRQSMAPLAFSDTALIVFRLDQQDYQGTGVFIDLARHLNANELIVVVNDVTSDRDWREVREQTEQTYKTEVGALIPHSDDLLVLGSYSVFALVYPEHSLVDLFQTLASRLLR
jgi:septum site-determining protein MinD